MIYTEYNKSEIYHLFVWVHKEYNDKNREGKFMNYFDLHCDTISECCNKGVSLVNNDLQLNVEKGKDILNWVQVYAIWIDDEWDDEGAYAYFNKVHQYFLNEVNKCNALSFCTSSHSVYEELKKGKRSALLSIEGSRALGGKIERVQEFYDKGVRAMTLTWNGRTKVADGCMVKEAKGLSEFGREVIKKMNEVGMIIDVSHLAEKGFWDVAHLSQKPFVATHSNSKTVCGHPRNLTDEQFRFMVKNKGLVGMNFYPLFINGTYEARIEELLPHIDHFMELGGESIIAMGSDFDGAKMPVNMRGLQDIPYLYNLLIRRYGKKRAEKFLFQNAYEFFNKNI